LKAGNLVTALEAKGPFTVFAPSNEAFDKLPAGELKKLLEPANLKVLDAVLEYHVVAGAAVHSKDLKPENKFKTLEGQDLLVEVRDEHVYINRESKVTAADNDATNGVVHIVDHVLIPPKKPTPPTPPAPGPATKNIVELAEGDKDLSTLVTALTAGKLVTALEGKGPFTVFAPSNEAFDKLPAGELKKLLDPANIKLLDSILEYHVVEGAAVHSKDLKPENKFKTLEGQELLVESRDGHVYINRKARVTAADNDATNGVVHIIDNVLVPPKKPTPPTPPAPGPAGKNIVELAEGDKDLSTLVTALKAGKLVTALEGKGPFTVFAPSNEAFAKVPKEELEKLLDPKNIKLLDAVLEYHVVEGAAVHSKDLKPENRFKTLEGSELLVESRDGGVYINREAKVTAADNDASNGVVHIIDHVLVPHHFFIRKAPVAMSM